MGIQQCALLSAKTVVKANEKMVRAEPEPSRAFKSPLFQEAQIPISVAINGYIDALMGAKATKKRHIGTISGSSKRGTMGSDVGRRNPLRKLIRPT